MKKHKPGKPPNTSTDFLLYAEILLATIAQAMDDQNESIMEDPFRLSMLTVVAATRKLQRMAIDPRLSPKDVRRQRQAKIELISKSLKRTIRNLKEI